MNKSIDGSRKCKGTEKEDKTVLYKIDIFKAQSYFPKTSIVSINFKYLS